MWKRWWLGVVMLMIASVPAAAAASDWYSFAEAGTMWSFRRSNHDEVEFGDEPGAASPPALAVVTVWIIAGGSPPRAAHRPGYPVAREERQAVGHRRWT